jgi:cold shock protein
MKQGVVRWFDSKKGYGFIDVAGVDYFAHYKDIEMEGYKDLQEGQKVTFREKPTPRGLAAVDIKIVTNQP